MFKASDFWVIQHKWHGMARGEELTFCWTLRSERLRSVKHHLKENTQPTLKNCENCKMPPSLQKRKKPHLGACFPIDERSSQNQDLQTAGSRPERLREQTAMLATLGSQTTDRRPNEKLGQHHGARRRRTLSLRQQQPLHRTNIVRRKPRKTWHLTMTTWMALKWTFKPHLGPGLCQELCCTSRCLL